MRTGRLLVVVAVLLVGSGCGSGSKPAERLRPAESESTAESITQQRGGFGTYIYDEPAEIKGFRVEAVLPAPPDDRFVQEVEAYRAMVNAPAVFYALARLDNTAGVLDLKVNAITVVPMRATKWKWNLRGG